MSRMQDTLTHRQKTWIFHVYYDRGELPRQDAAEPLGANTLKTAEENANGVEALLSGDVTRFLAGDGDAE